MQRNGISAELESTHANGQWMVGVEEVERRLSICRRCNAFVGDGCRQMEPTPQRLREFVAALVRPELACRRWAS